MSADSSVVIGITTFRRPVMLRAALRSLEALEGVANVHVLIADNDASGLEGVRVGEEILRAGYRFPVSTCVVESRGFTYGRNAILNAAFHDLKADYVVTMDDDQTIDPGYLNALIATQRTTGADVVGPAVIPKFEIQPPTWASQCGVYTRDSTTRGVVPLLYGDGGVLLSKSVIGKVKDEWYDHAFAVSGGADAEFFLRLRDAGAGFARAADSVIYEYYPRTRITVPWAMKRAYRIGCTDVLILRKRGLPIHGRVIVIAKVLGALAVVPAKLLFSFGRPGGRVDALCQFSRALGKVMGLFGFRYNEYKVIHGG